MTNTAATPMTTRMIAGSLATVVTLVCAGMAGLSAVERSQTASGAIMFVALALVMVVCSHLLPALARDSKVVRWVFVACVGVTLYNHAYFFQSEKDASSAAAVAAVQPSADVLGIQAQLDLIVARALPVVAADMSNAKASVARAVAALERCSSRDVRCTSAQATLEVAKAKVDALHDERAQAIRAEGLREQLALAMTAHSAKVAAAGGNKVDISIARMLGIDASTVATATSILQSVVLEVVGALLWAVALPQKPVATPVHEVRRDRRIHIRLPEVRVVRPYAIEARPVPPRLIGWVQKAMAQHVGHPRDSPAAA
ncbi:MAG: hypothetical protein K2Q11_02600 [Burkholderiaceae bacterium]|nr:hypothetical protein [Burkholderiaceae bacterium]